MTNSILGFNSEALLKYNISPSEIIFLIWLKTFASSINIKRWVDEKTKDTYFWIKYSKVLDDLPPVFKNISQLQKAIKNLSSENIGEKPLVKKLIKTRKGTDTYFAFDPIVRIAMEDKPMTSLIDNKPISTRKEKKQEHKLNKNIEVIVNDLLSIEKPDGTKLFRDTKPKDSYTYTQGIKTFAEKLYSIYEGRFNCRYFMEQSFIKKNNSIDFDKAKKAITSCKDDWGKIRELLLKAANNYISWFDNDCFPENKDWLRKNLTSWLYDPIMKGSLFLVCIDGPAYPLREVSAETIYNSINPRIRTMFVKYYQESWDGFNFWIKVKSLEKYYNKHAQSLMNKDSNCAYWLDRGKVEWLYEYLQYINLLTDNKPYPKNFGTNCPTFVAWLNQIKKDHEISIDLPKI